MQSPFGQESGVGVRVGRRVGVGGMAVDVSVGGTGVRVGGSPNRVRLTAMQEMEANTNIAIRKTGTKRFIKLLLLLIAYCYAARDKYLNFLSLKTASFE